MINELLKDPAYYRLFKNAKSLDAGDIAQITNDVIPTIPATVPLVILTSKPATSPPMNTTTVINTSAPKNQGGGNFLAIIGIGLVVGIVAYNLYEYYNKKNKPNKI